MEDIKNKIKELSEREVLTAEEKEYIRQLCAEVGINVSFKSRCRSCYTDALALLWRYYNGAPSVPAGGGKYAFLGTSPVEWWRSGAVTRLDATSDEKTIARFISENPAQKFFEIIETKGETEND